MQSKLQCKETTVLALNNVYIIYIYISYKKIADSRNCVCVLLAQIWCICATFRISGTLSLSMLLCLACGRNMQKAKQFQIAVRLTVAEMIANTGAD